MHDNFNHLLPEIREYLDRFSTIEDGLQQRMRAQAVVDGLEHWIIPAEVGRLFYVLAKICGAKQIYEIGSYLGYSASWFAKALPDDGRVVLTENNENRFREAVAFFAENPYPSKVILRNCDALQDLAVVEERFDIILIDHDKPHYCDAFQVAKTKIKNGGLIIADNVLWRNRIVDSQWQEDPSTHGVLEFNRMIMNDPDVVSLILPIGDGVSLSYAIEANRRGGKV